MNNHLNTKDYQVIDSLQVEDETINNEYKEVNFMFKNGNDLTYDYDKINLICLRPEINQKNGNIISIIVPENIAEKDLIEYFDYVLISKNDKNLFSNYDFENIHKHLSILEFLNNQKLIKEIIINKIIPNINFNNAINLLELAYSKLFKNENQKEVWFNLFYDTINFMAKNFVFYIKSHYDIVTNINKKILEEVLNK